jgi:hypothetical protein
VSTEKTCQTLNPKEFYQIEGGVTVSENHVNRLLKDIIKLKKNIVPEIEVEIPSWRVEIAEFWQNIIIQRKENSRINESWAQETKALLNAKTIDDLLEIEFIDVVTLRLNFLQRLKSKSNIKKIVKDTFDKGGLEDKAKLLALQGGLFRKLKIYKSFEIKEEVANFLEEVKNHQITSELFINISRSLRFSGLEKSVISSFYNSLNVEEILNLGMNFVDYESYLLFVDNAKRVEFLEKSLQKTVILDELEAIIANIGYIDFDVPSLDILVTEVFEKFCNSDQKEEVELCLQIVTIKRFEEMFQKLILNENVQALIFNRLYQKAPVKFYEHEFEKTGSRTVLLGGKLKGKIINRVIKADAFEAWKYAYINIDWKKEGFDYVPIEPIQSVRRNKKDSSLVEVKSGVLDISAADWSGYTQLFANEIGLDISKIIDVLNEKRIYHGHPHRGNHCLRFFRNSDGSVDFTTNPRVYLIDFDAAYI